MSLKKPAAGWAAGLFIIADCHPSVYASASLPQSHSVHVQFSLLQSSQSQASHLHATALPQSHSVQVHSSLLQSLQSQASHLQTAFLEQSHLVQLQSPEAQSLHPQAEQPHAATADTFVVVSSDSAADLSASEQPVKANAAVNASRAASE